MTESGGDVENRPDAHARNHPQPSNVYLSIEVARGGQLVCPRRDLLGVAKGRPIFSFFKFYNYTLFH